MEPVPYELPRAVQHALLALRQALDADGNDCLGGVFAEITFENLTGCALWEALLEAPMKPYYPPQKTRTDPLLPPQAPFDWHLNFD